ncbi:MAG: hypothetical protein ACR2LT_07620 [Pyrinomonadaceae bacterium]
MKKQILLILSLSLGISGLTFAQATRTITNADLEKFRQKREQAERDYNENYQRLGMPSPEELKEREAFREAQLAEDADRARILEQQEYDLQLRANELRMRQDLTDAQIDYIRSQIGNAYYQSPVFLGGQVSTPYGYGGGYLNGNYGWRGYRQYAPLPPNVQIVRNAANSFPTANDIRNQIYGIPARQIRGGRGSFGRRH